MTMGPMTSGKHQTFSKNPRTQIYGQKRYNADGVGHVRRKFIGFFCNPVRKSLKLETVFVRGVFEFETTTADIKMEPKLCLNFRLTDTTNRTDMFSKHMETAFIIATIWISCLESPQYRLSSFKTIATHRIFKTIYILASKCKWIFNVENSSITFLVKEFCPFPYIHWRCSRESPSIRHVHFTLPRDGSCICKNWKLVYALFESSPFVVHNVCIQRNGTYYLFVGSGSNENIFSPSLWNAQRFPIVD